MSNCTATEQPDQNKLDIYAPEVVTQIPRLLSSLDREPASQSYGSFDREHWGWKFRDFPITMLQAALYPLALLYRFPFPDNYCYQNIQVVENQLLPAIIIFCWYSFG